MSISFPKYPISFIVFLAISSTFNLAFVVIWPAIVTVLLLANVSTATLEFSSCLKHSSNIASDIVSHNLSVCPSVTLYDVK